MPAKQAVPAQVSTTFGGGTLETTSTFTLNSNRGIALTVSGTFLTDPSTILNYNGIIDGPGNLTKSGTGTLVLSGASTYAGATTISAGTSSPRASMKCDTIAMNEEETALLW